MSPHARSAQHHRLWWRTWLRQHARAIRRATRHAQEAGPLLASSRAALHVWAVQHDGHVGDLPAPQQIIYHRYRGAAGCPP